MSPLYGIGMAAMGRASASLQGAAKNLAGSASDTGTGSAAPVTDMVTLQTAGIQFKIAATLVKSADETTARLLDVFA
jgi:hypothetical protein